MRNNFSNRWVQLIIVPQNGGRLMQVTFAGHPYLFVNPKFAGKYLPPNPAEWFNYGGDKLWLLPEGNDDEQHWVGNSDLLDDGHSPFERFRKGRVARSNLRVQPILRRAFNLCAQFAWTPTPRASHFTHR